MFTDIKEEVAKHQVLFNHKQEQAAHDRENMTCEWEEMKHLNDQLIAHIMTLQNTRGPSPHQKGPLLRSPKWRAFSKPKATQVRLSNSIGTIP